MAAGNTIELAMSALFQLCVPAVSGGLYPQTFPPALVVELTAAERKEYGIAANAKAHRIKSDKGFILLALSSPYCSIVTGDGSSAEAVASFMAGLKKLNATVEGDENTAAGRNIAGQVQPTADTTISITLATKTGKDATGFYGSASMWKAKKN